MRVIFIRLNFTRGSKGEIWRFANTVSSGSNSEYIEYEVRQFVHEQRLMFTGKVG